MKFVSAHRDRHGKVRYKFRKTGCEPRYINAEYGTPEFEAEVAEALATHFNHAAKQRRIDRIEQEQCRRRARDLAAAKTEPGAFVYIVGASSGPVKIGFSNDIRSRLIKLQVGHPQTLRILAKVPGDKNLEKELHRRFAPARIRGEWFRRTPEIKKVIIDLSNPLSGLDKSSR